MLIIILANHAGAVKLDNITYILAGLYDSKA